jgi:hypothetical protein
MQFNPKIQAIVATLGLMAQALTAQSPSTVANGDTISTTVTKGPIVISNLLANDTDAEGDPLTIVNVGTPMFGKAVLSSGNVVTYTPGRLFKGEDSFTYRINDRPNGLGNGSTATVVVRNPFLIGRGLYASKLSGTGGSHDVSGYLSANVGPAGDFTSTFRFAGKSYRFKGKFNISGNFSGEIARPGQPSLQLALLFAVTGNTRQITGTVTSGAETIQFAAPKIPWGFKQVSPLQTRFTVVLPAPNTQSTTPQGNGYALTTVNRNGQIHFTGRTGDGRPFSSMTYLPPNAGVVPVYGIIYSAGSIFGDLTTNRSLLSRAAGPIGLSGNLRWFTSRNPDRLAFPNGFDLTIAARGSVFSEPTAGSAILSVAPATGFNGSFTASAGSLRAPRSERVAVGRRPIAGPYAFAFDNTKRLAAKLSVSPRNGLFGGLFTDNATKRTFRFSGVFVQSENKAFGVWSSWTKSGKVELLPDPINN